MILVLVVPIRNAVVEFKELKGEAVSTVPQNSNTQRKKKMFCAFKFSIKPYAFVLNFSTFVIYLQSTNFSLIFLSWCSVAE